MLTAPTKQWQEQYGSPASKPEPKVISRKVKENTYGFHKFCGLIISFAFILGILLLTEQALIITHGYKINTIQKEIEALKTSNDRLQLKMSQLKALDRIEYIAMSQLNMVKPGDDSKEFMDIKPNAVTPVVNAGIKVETMPGKTQSPFIEAINDIVGGWVTQASSTQINPKG